MSDKRPQFGSRSLRVRYVVRKGELVEVPLEREAPIGLSQTVANASATSVTWTQMEVYAVPAPLPRDLVAGPIIGWRLWRVTKKRRLQSLAYGSVWQPGKPMAGDPRPGNSHGVYAMKTRADVEADLDNWDEGAVLGEVALWGRVIEHEHGYRAQFGYPLRLHMRATTPMPNFPMPGFPRARHGEVDLAQALHDRYGIEVLI